MTIAWQKSGLSESMANPHAGITLAICLAYCWGPEKRRFNGYHFQSFSLVKNNSSQGCHTSPSVQLANDCWFPTALIDRTTSSTCHIIRQVLKRSSLGNHAFNTAVSLNVAAECLPRIADWRAKGNFRYNLDMSYRYEGLLGSSPGAVREATLDI